MSSIGDGRYSEILFVSFYTGKYAMAAGELYDSLLRFNLRNNLYYSGDKGSWYLNTQYKPEFIRNVLHATNVDIVWIDSDAVVKKHPQFLFDLVNSDYDVAAYIHKSDEHLPRLCSGTIYLANNDRVKGMVDLWCKDTKDRVKEDPKTWDQDTLAAALMVSGKCEFQYLPPEYCMWDDVKKKFPKIDPVIEHKQMSRQILQEQGFDNV